jgi:hypothetical protein
MPMIVATLSSSSMGCPDREAQVGSGGVDAPLKAAPILGEARDGRHPSGQTLRVRRAAKLDHHPCRGSVESHIRIPADSYMLLSSRQPTLLGGPRVAPLVPA